MNTSRVRLTLLVATLVIGTAASGALAESQSLMSDGNSIRINEAASTQAVFVERNAQTGEFHLLVPKSRKISHSTWMATMSWVNDNKGRLERVLTNALSDAMTDAEVRKVGAVIYLNYRIHDWMQEIGAYDEIEAESGRRVAQFESIEKQGCGPMCSECQKYVCYDFDCDCATQGVSCCVIEIGP